MKDELVLATHLVKFIFNEESIFETTMFIAPEDEQFTKLLFVKSTKDGMDVNNYVRINMAGDKGGEDTIDIVLDKESWHLVITEANMVGNKMSFVAEDEETLEYELEIDEMTDNINRVAMLASTLSMSGMGEA